MTIHYCSHICATTELALGTAQLFRVGERRAIVRQRTVWQGESSEHTHITSVLAGTMLAAAEAAVAAAALDADRIPQVRDNKHVETGTHLGRQES
jgi:hypothetical protein